MANRYHCPVPDAERLASLFRDLCSQYGIATRIRLYQPDTAQQLSLF
jgi:hypothetical protein